MSEPRALRFLADESCDFAIVRALRSEGYDVFAVNESESRTNDGELIERAARDGRILLTEDKDFGWLVYVRDANSAGVILVRYPATVRKALASSVLALVQEHADELYGAFTVLQPGQIRFSHKPQKEV